MVSTQSLVEEQILKAQKAGKFDNLEGMGEPLNLEENPFEPDEVRMVFRILKRNNYAPYWIELGNDIDADIEKFWQEVENLKIHQIIFLVENNRISIKRFENKQNRFLEERKAILQNINKKITDFNLHCPAFHLTRHNLNVINEMEKVRNRIKP